MDIWDYSKHEFLKIKSPPDFGYLSEISGNKVLSDKSKAKKFRSKIYMKIIFLKNTYVKSLNKQKK